MASSLIDVPLAPALTGAFPFYGRNSTSSVHNLPLNFPECVPKKQPHEAKRRRTQLNGKLDGK